jgi:hypothetical protein
MFKFFKKSTIKVRLIEASDNDLIDEVNLPLSQLPQSFKSFTTMHINDQDWQVVKAEPEEYAEFYRLGELTLWLRPIVRIDPSLIRYSIPTISNELPGVSDSAPFNDFTLMLHEDDWRQIEFLPSILLPAIQEEMADVEAIIFPEDDPNFNSLNGFDKINVRSRIGKYHLSIPLEAFCERAGITQRGNIAFQGYTGFVKNGFALKGAHYTWYGITEKDLIMDLAIDFFDSKDDEIMQMLRHYDLLMVEWCKGSITAA